MSIRRTFKVLCAASAIIVGIYFTLEIGGMTNLYKYVQFQGFISSSTHIYGYASDSYNIYRTNVTEETLNSTTVCGTYNFEVHSATQSSLRQRYVESIPVHQWVSSPEISTETDISPTANQVVHYVWCGGIFAFRNFLSVMSVVKYLKPSKIVFHYKSLPTMDKNGYNTKFGDILRDIPHFYTEPLGDKLNDSCSGERNNMYKYISSLLQSARSIYMETSIVISQEFKQKQNDRGENLSQCEPDSIVVSHSEKGREVRCVKCPEEGKFNAKEHICVAIGKDLFPKDIITDGSDFSTLCSEINFGWKEIAKTSSRESELVPMIVHYVNFGVRGFEFYKYLSVLSSLYVLGADTVYVHGDQEPTGDNWNKAKATGKVKFIYRDYPTAFFGHNVYHVSHPSDLVRLDALSKYGGFYLDWDACFVQPITKAMRSYDFGASIDWPKQRFSPASLNFGVGFGKKNASIFGYFIEEYRHYLVRDRPYNPVEILYQVFENHPDKFILDPHIQVICHFGKCHPTWKDDYWLEKNSHLNVLKFDWKTEAYAIHWTYPDPPEFGSLEALKKSKGLYAEIGQFILKKAGLM